MNYKQLSCIYLCIFLFFCAPSFAREFDKEYYLKNLKTQKYSIDTEASAVILYENIYTHIIGSNGIYNKKETVHKIIKILKADAVSLGDIHIVYAQDIRTSTSSFKATTYNLDGDKVVESVVAKDDQLKKKLVDDEVVMSFSMPAVKQGSIIEYSYEIVSYFDMNTIHWQIEGDYPKLESEFSVTFPKSVQFTTISHSPFKSKTFQVEEEAEKSADSFCFVARMYETSQKALWLRRNIRGVKEESYVVNRPNQLERLEMQITGIRGNVGMLDRYNSWDFLNKELWEGFGGMKETLNGARSAFKKDVDSLVGREMDAVEKTTVLYKYLRWRLKDEDNNSFGRYDLKNTYILRRGTPNDMNLTLVAMLRYAGVNAAPILLSTTNHISSIKNLPVLDRISFIACAVTVDSNLILLDVSDKNNPVGALAPYFYNGYSWILGDKGSGVYLTPDMLTEKMVISVKISDFGDSTAHMEIIQKLGMIASAQKRKEWALDQDKAKKKFTEFKKMLPDDVTVTECTIDNENNPDANLIIREKCTLSFDKNTTNFYLPSNLIKFFESNPFKEAKRQLIIEFPYTFDYSYHLNIELPKNTAPETVTDPVMLDFDNGGMSYKKTISHLPDMNMITVNTVLNVNNTAYNTDKYSGIKDFFQKIVDDNNQMIVLKKTMK